MDTFCSAFQQLEVASDPDARATTQQQASDSEPFTKPGGYTSVETIQHHITTLLATLDTVPSSSSPQKSQYHRIEQFTDILWQRDTPMAEDGAAAQALEALEDTMDLLRGGGGNLHSLAYRLCRLSCSLSDLGLMRESVALGDCCIGILRQLVGPSDTSNFDLAVALKVQAQCLSDASQYQLAVTASEEAVDLFRSSLAGSANDERRTAMIMVILAESINQLSAALLSNGQEAESLDALEEAYDICQRLDGRGDVLSLRAMTMTNLAAGLQAVGQLENAMKAMRGVVEIRRAQWHPEELAKALCDLSLYHAKLHQWSEATVTAQESAALLSYGSDVAMTARAYYLLSACLENEFRDKDAAEAATRSLQCCRAIASGVVIGCREIYRPWFVLFLGCLRDHLEEAARRSDAEEVNVLMRQINERKLMMGVSSN